MSIYDTLGSSENREEEQHMYMLTIFLEESAFGGVRPLEVAADIPVAALIPKLVAELNLPQTDLFGKELVYMLRHAGGGRVIPEQATLQDAGIQDKARLVLDSYVLDDSVAAMMQQRQRFFNDASLHSSDTISDVEPSVPVGVLPREERTPETSVSSQWSGPVSAPLSRPPRSPRKRSRRRFLLLAGGVALGIGGIGLGYAAYAQFMHSQGNMQSTKVGNTGQRTPQQNTGQTPT